MAHFLRRIAALLFHFGGPGLLVLGIMDSSFLTMPLGNDLLVVALSASHHTRMPYYVLMATVGSVLGCLMDDWISRKGEQGIKKHVESKRLDYVERQVARRAWAALLMASLMPPPFPFTPVVVGAAAFEYPRKKLLGIVGVGRVIRFTAEGALAIHYGPSILSLAQSRTLEHVIIALIVISIAASTISIYRWVKKSGQKNIGRSKPSSSGKRVA